MGKVLGQIVPSSGLGNKTFTIGITATSVTIIAAGKSGNDTYQRLSVGKWDKASGFNRTVSIAPGVSSEPVPKVLSLRNSSGVVEYEATVVSTGSNQIVFNFTANPATAIPFIIEADDL